MLEFFLKLRSFWDYLRKQCELVSAKECSEDIYFNFKN